ncbi:meteorin-like protein [Trichomycterus rosablanca]|uniref:meteorin-like protein n=1 Tax=Trichomycterus rosablanca TaxID=2290929 RepID=UPI002F35F4DF
MSPRGNGLLHFLQSLCFLWSCKADLCSWSGSGLAGSSLSGSVQQVRLRCSAGSVTWFSPRHALRVVLQPNVWSASNTTVCIKALRGFRSATVYVERSERLDLLLQDDQSPEQVRCFRVEVHSVAIFLQANPLSLEGPSIVALRYELLQQKSSVTNIPLNTMHDACRPCSDLEILKAVCTSDFVVRGSIRNISHDSVRQISVIEVEDSQVYRQRSGVFERDPELSSLWHGIIYTHMQCGVKAGAGQFLFTGVELFGEAWLGCAPRFKVFERMYNSARRTQQILCNL